MMEEIVKSLDRKDKPPSLQECQELKEKIGRIGDKIDEMVTVLKKNKERRQVELSQDIWI